MVLNQNTSSTVPVEQIVNFLVQQASQRQPHVLGAQLGNALRRFSPHTNLKLEYGGLQSFIRNHCHDKIYWLEKRGGDDVYTTIPPRSTHEAVSPSPSTKPTFWQAFANPGKKFIPAVNPTTQDVIASPTGEPLELGFIEIQKLTEEEHRNFAREFLKLLDRGDREVLSLLVERPNFWPEWSHQIATIGYGRHRSRWVAFRFERILNTLDARLVALNLPPASRLQLLDAVRRSKSPQSSSATQTGATQADTIVGQAVDTGAIVQSSESNPSELKALAHKVIDAMSEEELRRLWIPLGALGNASRPN